MGRIARRGAARRETRALADAREHEAAAYVLAVIDGRAPGEVPAWMPAALAVWVQHATAEIFARTSGERPAAAMERARHVIAVTAEGE